MQTAALLPWLLWAVEGYVTSDARGRGVLLAAIRSCASVRRATANVRVCALARRGLRQS